MDPRTRRAQESTGTQRQLPLVLVHEQDPAKGHCPFRVFFDQTPEVLLKRRRLYDTVAVPLYSLDMHRKISLRHILRILGGTAEPRRSGCHLLRLLGKRQPSEHAAAPVTQEPAAALSGAVARDGESSDGVVEASSV